MAELIRKDFTVECVELEGTWIYEVLPALVSVDKNTIVADGIDKSIVTATVPNGGDEITFYESDIEVATVKVIDGVATLEIKATVAGAINIRAGEKTRTYYNEGVVIAIV
jgi:hypothetical protein